METPIPENSQLTFRDLHDIKFQGLDMYGNDKGWFKFVFDERERFMLRHPYREEYFIKGDLSLNQILDRLKGGKPLTVCGGKDKKGFNQARLIVKRTRRAKITINIDPDALEKVVDSGNLKRGDFYFPDSTTQNMQAILDCEDEEAEC